MRNQLNVCQLFIFVLISKVKLITFMKDFDECHYYLSTFQPLVKYVELLGVELIHKLTDSADYYLTSPHITYL